VSAPKETVESQGLRLCTGCGQELHHYTEHHCAGRDTSAIDGSCSGCGAPKDGEHGLLCPVTESAVDQMFKDAYEARPLRNETTYAQRTNDEVSTAALKAWLRDKLSTCMEDFAGVMTDPPNTLPTTGHVLARKADMVRDHLAAALGIMDA
jgi:hypothetical protein